MARRNRRKQQRDQDFEIHVDPSCLSSPMDEKSEISSHEEPVKEVEHPESQTDTINTKAEGETPTHIESEPEKADENTKPEEAEAKAAAIPTNQEDELNNEAATSDEITTTDSLPDTPGSEEEEIEFEEQEPVTDISESPELPPAEAEATEIENEPPKTDETEPAAESIEETQEIREPEFDEGLVETSQQAEPEAEIEPETASHEPEVKVTELTEEVPEEAEVIQEPEAVQEEEATQDPEDTQEPEAAQQPHAVTVETVPEALHDEVEVEAPILEEPEAATSQEAVEAPAPTEEHTGAIPEDTNTEASESRRESAISGSTRSSSRRTSKRTEALIQAAARDIVAQMERNRSRESFRSSASTENASYISRSARSSHVDDRYTPSRQSYMSDSRGVEDAGDSSSHHENEDDVFSDNSPRSSMGSTSENDHKKMEDRMPYKTRSPRISNISQYEHEEEFVPTVRGTPRPPFRSPSSVKALQMSSPPASVIGSPRSSRRTPLPAVSRIGSPSVSAQYSPKKTPPRFRRTTPPLVLLHVTLLPLRWAWGDVLDSALTDELSEETKTLREAWRQLQDRLGDTVCERGILLPHPQSDYEILEERLLEALELPMRRRARILECGHYLGPSNENTLVDDTESEDDDDDYYDGVKAPRDSIDRKTHWCTTCRSDIRYDSLGPGKIFRVKVYASNGLMKAGAWEACWKEMERVDVELEPIVDPGVQDELNRIAAEQEQALELREVDEEEVDEEEEQHDEGPAESSFMDHEHEHEHVERHIHHEERHVHLMPSSPPPPEITISSSPPTYDERRRRDEERLKEIYGHSPPQLPPVQEPPSSPPRAPEYVHESPPSPSAQVFERREERRQAVKNDSLPELLLQAGRVLMQDRKNVAIILLSVFVLLFAVRGGSGVTRPEPDPRTFQTLVRSPDVSTVTVTQSVAQPTVDYAKDVMSVVASQASESTRSVEAQPSAEAEKVEVAAPPREPETVISEKVVRIVETVTETAIETVQVTATYTQTGAQTKTEYAHLQSETVEAEAEAEAEAEVVEAQAVEAEDVEEEVVSETVQIAEEAEHTEAEATAETVRAVEETEDTEVEQEPEVSVGDDVDNEVQVEPEAPATGEDDVEREL
ncbi:hypothetical protein HJFPF1_04708 [Paramyrothecium foliicola]|nr:hypothetical protein HJFPF1_04708 [Paramyrothecium foliicola]